MSPKIVHDILNFRCAAGDDLARKPKLFYVSTSAQTTTLSTASVCYVTSGTPTTCTGRKRRSIKIDGAQLADVKPSQLNQQVQSSQKDAEKHREGRFLLYWITTTSILPSTKWTPIGLSIVLNTLLNRRLMVTKCSPNDQQPAKKLSPCFHEFIPLISPCTN